jgi:hypothetical protein
MATSESGSKPTVEDQSVETLIKRWRNGDLPVDAGEVRKAGTETIEVKYQGSDGILTVTYNLAEELAFRTDVEGAGRFNILTEEAGQ